MVSIPLSAVIFCLIAFSAVLGAVAINALKDSTTDCIGIVAIILIVALMCTGAYLCR